MSSHRRDSDLLKLMGAYEVETMDTTNNIFVKFLGPSDTPYKGGIFKIHAFIPSTYPFQPPILKFVNKIYHPNISIADGKVCMDVLSTHWTPIYDLSHIFDTFLPQLLRYPNPDDPLNREASLLIVDKPNEYKLRVEAYVIKFGTESAILALQIGNKNMITEDDENSDNESIEVNIDIYVHGNVGNHAVTNGNVVNQNDDNESDDDEDDENEDDDNEHFENFDILNQSHSNSDILAYNTSPNSGMIPNTIENAIENDIENKIEVESISTEGSEYQSSDDNDDDISN